MRLLPDILALLINLVLSLHSANLEKVSYRALFRHAHLPIAQSLLESSLLSIGLKEVLEGDEVCFAEQAALLNVLYTASYKVRNLEQSAYS